MTARKQCAVGGLLAAPSRSSAGAMCGHIIVGGKLCGYGEKRTNAAKAAPLPALPSDAEPPPDFARAHMPYRKQ